MALLVCKGGIDIDAWPNAQKNEEGKVRPSVILLFEHLDFAPHRY